MSYNFFNITREQIYSILLGVFMFFLTIGYNGAAYSFIALLLFFLIDKNLIKKLKGLNISIYLPFFLYLLVLSIGLLYTSNIPKGLEELRVRLPLLLFPIVLLTEPISFNKVQKILLLFKYWLFVWALVLIAHKLKYHNHTLWDLSSFSLFELTGIHQLFFSQFYLLILVYIFYQHNNKQISTVKALVEIAFIVFFLVVLGSGLIIILALFFSFLYFLIALKSNILKISSILFLCVGMYAVKDTMLIKNRIYKLTHIEWNIQKNIEKHQIKDLNEFNSYNTLEFRILKWYTSVEIIKNNVLTGVGTGDYQDAINDGYKKIDFKNGIRSKFNSHNQFLEDFVKIGILGFVTVFSIFAIPLYFAYKQKNHLLMIWILISLATAIIESIFDRFHGVAIYAFFIPLAYVLKSKK